ncbi:MAG: HDIG domain-containing protein [Bacteroidales bacterium]|nr:HDIG domain-containing protein [Bacteroidales bacterium]
MKKFFNYLRKHYSEIYKIFLFLVAVVFLIGLFPKQATFKYEFNVGKPWMHDDLIALFDFAIEKTDNEIKSEREAILKDIKPYFSYDKQIYLLNRQTLTDMFDEEWGNKYPKPNKATAKLKDLSKQKCIEIFDTVFLRGIIELNHLIENKAPDYSIIILTDNVAVDKELDDLFTINTASDYIKNEVSNSQSVEADLIISVLNATILQNVIYDEETTEKEKQLLLDNISLTHGMIQNGERIISKGELITSDKYIVLESLKKEYESQFGLSSSYYLILAGQAVLVFISILVLVMFLYTFRKDIFEDNKRLLLILLLILFMVFITSIIVRSAIDYLYLLPLCIGPIMIRAFFDSKLSLFVHLIIVIIIGFLVPNSFEFVFLQLIAGIITIISIVNLQRRSQFFLTSVLIFVTFSAIYLGLKLIQDGSLEDIRYTNFALFGGNAILTLFSYPLIFIFEKLFGFVTDVSLMELSDTNNKLLRELNSKAPGTFQHSLQVSNIAEELIYEIGGNALLARTGALYHDIGKMDMPQYFIENQRGGFNPHDELTYEESARIIINHVIKGIEKAKKSNLPEQVIDFIRTHHGTRRIEYFYNLQQQNSLDDNVDDELFSYNGLIPYSKETSVVMMADSVEAASRSLKAYDEKSISKLVDQIIDDQVESKQFANSNITFRDISRIKKILKKKLLNIYHIRIEYPTV